MFKDIDPKLIKDNPFKMIGDDWMLITAEKDGKVNTMTASWGGMGVLWNKNVVFVFIRDSRFTKEFVDSAECFSLSVFDHQQYKKMLGYMGSVSGRKEDKIAACGLTVEHRTDTKCAGAPYFAEAKKVFICKKMYRAHMPPENFIDPSADAQFYANKDYHNVYIAEILQFSENE